MKPWGEWVQGRIQSIFEREFIALILFLYGCWYALAHDLVTLEVTGLAVTAAGAISNYAIQRRKAKNGG